MSDTTDDDLATLLAKREHARPNRLTWVLLVLLVIAVGFAGGAFVEKRNASSSSGLPDFAAMRAGGDFAGGGAFPGGTLPGGAGPGAATTTTAGAVTTGTVKLVDGTSLYITDADGHTVKVVVPETVPVTTQSQTSLGDLTAGSTVIIQGETGDDGTLTATSVSEGAIPGAATTTTPTTAPSPQGDNS